MKVSKYFCLIVGEDHRRTASYHPSTVKRIVAFALAIHLPVLLWGGSGFLIAGSVFELSFEISCLIALICSGAIYLVERIVLATPKSLLVNLLRLVMGLVIATLGASAVDLVVFDREIAEQLSTKEKAKISRHYNALIATRLVTVTEKKRDWYEAQEAANSEATGKQGSGRSGIGPVYRALLEHANRLRGDYIEALSSLTHLELAREEKLALHERDPYLASSTAGLLQRVSALHEYTSRNFAASVAWSLFFLLMLFFELMVVIAKMVFPQTVDDHLEHVREMISKERASAYGEAITHPSSDLRSAIRAFI